VTKILIIALTNDGIDDIHLALLSEPAFQIVGRIENDVSAFSKIRSLEPAVILLIIDINTPGCIKMTEELTREYQIPVVIVLNNADHAGTEYHRDLLRAGAIAVLAQPCSAILPEFERSAASFRNSLKVISEIKVTRKIESLRKIDQLSSFNFEREIRYIAIGASAGAPPDMERILASLNQSFSIPILVVQHISRGFIQGYVDWLNLSSKVRVKVAEDGEEIERGVCYTAPDDRHLEINNAGRIYLTDGPPLYGSKPSIGVLLQSLTAFAAKHSVAVLLSGMGRDGSAELKQLRENEGITVAQSANSALIFGIPGEAIKLDAAQFILSSDEIAELLNYIDFKQNDKEHIK
jgi:two-component system chemotaxis response regulator CheB